jgi:hypothetical protein
MSVLICPAAATPHWSSPAPGSRLRRARGQALAGDPVRRGLSAPPLLPRNTGSPGPGFAFGFAAAPITRGAPELQRRRRAGRRHRVLARLSRLNPSAPLAKSPRHGYIATARLRRASGTNISPGPYRSLRELSLAGSVDPDIWCPPTFVGNSGIERFNGDCGFALFSRVSPGLVSSGCRSAAFLRTFDRPPSAGFQRRHVACR